MCNTERRKLSKLSIGSHITPIQRRINKEEDGKSVRPFTTDERRYVARLNRYYGHSEAALLQHPVSLCE